MCQRSWRDHSIYIYVESQEVLQMIWLMLHCALKLALKNYFHINSSFYCWKWSKNYSNLCSYTPKKHSKSAGHGWIVFVLFFTGIFSKVYSIAEDLTALNIKIPQYLCVRFFCLCGTLRLTICNTWYFYYKSTKQKITEVDIQLGMIWFSAVEKELINLWKIKF